MREELSKFALLRGLNLGQAEVDYFQHIILFIIYSRSQSRLVFKGGTALQKCYFMERFSEDLDFSAEKNTDLKKIIKKGLKDFFIDFETEANNHPKGENLIFRLKGPLFNGNRNSFCRILVDISFRENVVLEPKPIKIAKIINEIPSFDVLVMNEEEILAEKIRAIYTRNKARDVFDVYFLLNRKVRQNKELINLKLEFDKIKFSETSFLKEISKKQNIWDSEMKPLLNNFIEFKEVFRKIKEVLK